MTIRKGLIQIDTNYLLGNYNIKRDLLYFDKLVYDTDELKLSEWIVKPIAKTLLKNKDHEELIHNRISELEYLKEKGLIETITSSELERAAKQRAIPGFKEYFEKNKGTSFFSTMEVMTMGSVFEASFIKTESPPTNSSSTYKNNFIALLNKAVTGEEVTPICFDKRFMTSVGDGKDYKVLEVVLNNIPMPDESVSYEQIFELKSDNELKRKFLALRNWMIDISKADYTAKEIEEKFEHLYHEYQTAMLHHKMATSAGNLKSFIITTAEVLENVVTLRWSTAAKTAFEIFDNQAKLAELEMNTTGRELAFIYELNKRLIHN